MDGAKIKTFIICLLLAVNLIFLALVGADAVRAAQLDKQLRKDLGAVLLENGVSFDTELLPNTEKLDIYTLNRDLEAEAALAASILGPAEGQDQGGNIYCYENEAGRARFRGNGEFEIVPAAPLDSGGRSEVEAARQILKDLDLPVLSSFTRTHSGDSAILRFLCMLDGAPVYNCYIDLCFVDGALVSISGRRPIGIPERPTAQVEMNPATALLSLLSYIQDSGQVCSAVTGLRCGYSMTVSVSGEAELLPVWDIETDVGSFYVNPSSLNVELWTI